MIDFWKVILKQAIVRVILRQYTILMGNNMNEFVVIGMI